MTAIHFKKNGYCDAYPHSDFGGPCTCAECCGDPEAGYVPSCGVCGSALPAYGLCQDCVETEKGHEYMQEH